MVIWPVAELKRDSQRALKKAVDMHGGRLKFRGTPGPPKEEVSALASAVLGVVALGRDLETRKKALGRAMRILWDSG